MTAAPTTTAPLTPWEIKLKSIDDDAARIVTVQQKIADKYGLSLDDVTHEGMLDAPLKVTPEDHKTLRQLESEADQNEKAWREHVEQPDTQTEDTQNGNETSAVPPAAKAEQPAAKTEATISDDEDLNPDMLDSTRVTHRAYIADEKKWAKAEMSAAKALADIDDDISTYRALLNCLKG